MSTHQTMNTAGARPARLSLTPQERKASILLALLFACRMLGLFLLTPVFAVAAHSLPGGNDAARVGLALGAYGLTQAVLQIPLGMASDRFGRRPIIVIGMALFVIGGVISAMAQSIDWVTVGRCVQGLGAVSAAISAWVADSTRPEVRTRAMAMVGGSIGLSFAVSLVLSPVLVGQFGLSGLFWAISLLGFVCLLVAAFVVPSAPKAPASIVQVTAGQVLRHMDLLRLNFGVFCLHFILMSLFIVVPGILATLGGYGTQDLWKVYLPVILVSFVLMVPAVFWTETRKRHKHALELAVLLLMVVLALMPWARVIPGTDGRSTDLLFYWFQHSGSLAAVFGVACCTARIQRLGAGFLQHLPIPGRICRWSDRGRTGGARAHPMGIVDGRRRWPCSGC